MKHTECEDCKLRNGDCGHHFKMNGKGKTNYDIPSLTACDRYGDCMFFQQKDEEKPKVDLISRKALKEKLKERCYNDGLDIVTAIELIDNAPTVEPDAQDFKTEIIRMVNMGVYPEAIIEWVREQM